jgi:hypothetical protein
MQMTNDKTERTTREIGNGWVVLGTWKGAVYVRVDNPVAIDGGCACDYCKAHPNETPAWDTMVIPPASATNQHTWTVHMPDVRRFCEEIRKDAARAERVKGGR